MLTLHNDTIMNKRTLKKRVFYIISDAVDHVVLDTKQVDPEKKTGELLNLYDATLDKINECRYITDKGQVKAHFRKVKDDFNKSIRTILS